MTSRKIEVFFYGLFMDQDLLRQKGLDPQQVELARADGFALRVGQRAALVPMVSSAVHGMVMRLTHQELEYLYSEESVRIYRPEALLVELASGRQAAALTFNLASPPSSDERNEDYAKKLRELGRRLRLPDAYVASII